MSKNSRDKTAWFSKRLLNFKVEIIPEIKVMITEVIDRQEDKEKIEVNITIDTVNQNISRVISLIYPDGSIEVDDCIGNVHEAFSNEPDSLEDLDAEQLFSVMSELQDILDEVNY